MKRTEAQNKEYLSWLWRETWHAGDVLRRMGERGADPSQRLLQAGLHDGLVRALAYFADRDPDLIRNVATMDALWDLVKNGPSWSKANKAAVERALRGRKDEKED